MAQTSSATREPSMEEILASIRRIIEDSDVTKQATADLTGSASELQPDTRPENAASFIREAEERRGEVAQFPRSLNPELEQAAVLPLNLQAVLRGTIDVKDNSVSEAHERSVSHVRIATVNPPVPPIVAAVPLQPKQEDVAVSKTVKASEALLMHVAEKHVHTIGQQPPQSEAILQEKPVSVEEAETINNSDIPLISRVAQEQVAASFGSLSQVLLDEQKRLMNEKVEAMLRPMLQEWLDMHLPKLVERLVREEIERVVRRG
jgi:cell pole-organizing protein PopZ